MVDNDDLGFDLDLGMNPPPEPQQTKTKKSVAKKEAAVDPVVEEEIVDPEDDRANWPTIYIDSEDGKPNYEFIAAHGTKKDGSPFDHELQVMREVNVKVPPSVVYLLQESTATHYAQRRGADGRMQLVAQNRAPIPWRLVDGGKYIK